MIHHSPLDTCAETGVWFPMGIDGDFPEDQRIADGQSLCFDMETQTEPAEILGHPQLKLEISVNQPMALVAARLCDVSPQGDSLLVSWGLFNLCHHRSHENPEPLIPNQKIQVEFPLRACAHRLLPGHRWRLSLSTWCFPHAWPSPKLVELQVHPGNNTFLTLPVREKNDSQTPRFEPSESSIPLDNIILSQGRRNRVVSRDAANGKTVLEDQNFSGRFLFQDSGLEMENKASDRLEITRDHPLSMITECQRTASIGRGDWQTRIETKSRMTSDEMNFYLENHLEAYENDHVVFQKSWKTSVPRSFV